MNQAQAGILLPIPTAARYLAFSLAPGADPRSGLRALRELADGERLVVGLGPALVHALAAHIEGLRVFPPLAGIGAEIPVAQHALWVWVRGDERGEVFHRALEVVHALGGAFRLEQSVDAFRHREGRDLSGYEDGTENPEGEAAEAAALVRGAGAAPEGSSFVVVQRWLHDFDRLGAMAPGERDDAIGRRLSDNEEFDDAPASAHVKRTAQESFEPEAFVLRRSMPWTEGMHGGLVFVAFGAAFDAFEAQLRRMIGLEDGIEDALFRFTRPLDGAYYWCPPMRAGRLDLSAVGL